ncbi:MAG: hypothetical protein IJY04_05425, partial [Clostridia bacterium]|nr:hypothetical protein [Clostridia bacterium]
MKIKKKTVASVLSFICLACVLFMDRGAFGSAPNNEGVLFESIEQLEEYAESGEVLSLFEMGRAGYYISTDWVAEKLDDITSGKAYRITIGEPAMEYSSIYLSYHSSMGGEYDLYLSFDGGTLEITYPDEHGLEMLRSGGIVGYLIYSGKFNISGCYGKTVPHESADTFLIDGVETEAVIHGTHAFFAY